MYEAVSSGAVPKPNRAMESKTVFLKSESGRTVLRRDSFDAGYIQRLKDSDPETELHFSAYFGELLAIKLRARLHDPQLIEDLSQETFLRVLTAIKTNNALDSPECLGSFVNSVCNNLLFEQYRRQSRQKNMTDCDQIKAPGTQTNAESAMVTEERRHEVRQVLQELAPKDRELLRMVFFEEADRDQICRSFQVEREYLRVLVHRAKARFRECLLKRYAEGRPADA